MAIKSGTIAIALVVATGAIIGGWRLYADAQLRGFQEFYPAPGRVNLIAINPGSGYRIIVSSDTASLAEVSGDTFGGGAERDPEAQDIISQRKLPIRELIGSLSGNEKDFSRLAMFLNELSPDDLPTNPIIWTPEDLTKALDGDPALRQKLERDINTKLDGTPLDGFSINSVIESIVLAVPVPVEVTIKGEKRTLTATVLEQFQTRFAAQVAKRFTERFRTNEQLIGLYREEANRVATGDAVREDVALSLRERISPNRINQLAEKPRRVLENARILITNENITQATDRQYEGPNQAQLTDVILQLDRPGHLQLWKYSRQKPGFQLLFVKDGVALAAPRITTELAESKVTITGMRARNLALDAVKLINELRTQNQGQ